MCAVCAFDQALADGISIFKTKGIWPHYSNCCFYTALLQSTVFSAWDVDVNKQLCPRGVTVPRCIPPKLSNLDQFACCLSDVIRLVYEDTSGLCSLFRSWEKSVRLGKSHAPTRRFLERTYLLCEKILYHFRHASGSVVLIPRNARDRFWGNVVGCLRVLINFLDLRFDAVLACINYLSQNKQHNTEMTNCMTILYHRLKWLHAFSTVGFKLYQRITASFW